MQPSEQSKPFLKGLIIGSVGMLFAVKIVASKMAIKKNKDISKINSLEETKFLLEPPERIITKRRNTIGYTPSKGVCGIGMDIGGTLTKVVYFEPFKTKNEEEEERKKLICKFIKNLDYGETGQNDKNLKTSNLLLGGTMYFFKFATDRMQNLLRQIKDKNIMKMVAPRLTGGGAAKFDAETRGAFKKTKLVKKDELRALIQGLDFIRTMDPESCYYLKKFSLKAPTVFETHTAEAEMISYPYIVVNIGSGVSIMKVSGMGQFERVGGSALGGGTFLGLCRALTKDKESPLTFKEAIELTKKGNSDNVTLLISDIYGGHYDAIGLPGDIPAAYFGKLTRKANMENVRVEDLAKAALTMITNNIGSLANLYAHKVLHVPNILFMGSFLQNNNISRSLLAHSTDYWSNHKNQAIFIKHEGYLGAIGSFLEKKYSSERARQSTNNE